MRIAKVQEAMRKPVGRNSSRSVAFKTSTRAIQVTSEPWGSRSTQASLVASNAGERPPTSLNAGSIAKRPEWKTILLSTHFGHVRPNATLTFFAVAETLVDSSRRHSRTHPDGDGMRPYGVARCTQISDHCPFSSGQADCVAGTAASSAGTVATRSYRSQGPRL